MANFDKDTVRYIINVLRKGTIAWEGRKNTFKLARKQVLVGTTKDGRPKFKYHWQCAECKTWLNNDKLLEVDHIQEIGPFKDDWNEFIRRMYFCGQENLQLLCLVCHARKTAIFTSSILKYQRRKVFSPED